MQAFVAPRLPTGIRHIEVFPSIHEVLLRHEDGCRGLSRLIMTMSILLPVTSFIACRAHHLRSCW